MEENVNVMEIRCFEDEQIIKAGSVGLTKYVILRESLDTGHELYCIVTDSTTLWAKEVGILKKIMHSVDREAKFESTNYGLHESCGIELVFFS